LSQATNMARISQTFNPNFCGTHMIMIKTYGAT